MKTVNGLYRVGPFVVTWTYRQNQRVLGAHHLFVTGPLNWNLENSVGLIAETDKVFKHTERYAAQKEFFALCRRADQAVSGVMSVPRFYVGAYTAAWGKVVLLPMYGTGHWDDINKIALGPACEKGTMGYDALLAACDGQPVWLFNQSPAAL